MSVAEWLETRIEGDVLVARLSGEIDLANAGPIGSEISRGVGNDLAGVVLDLSTTSYLDSSGVHLVFDLAERLASRQQCLALVLPEGARVRRVLELVNVSAVAPVVPVLDEALTRVRGGGGR
ncbi:MAG TPA: STAS domain-containing protein [Thermoleophilaceae bacterium]|jgi:anti-anti-sigma factor